MPILAIICAVIGFVLAVKLPILIQGIVVVIALVSTMRAAEGQEIGGIIPVIMFLSFCAGLAIGDIYFYANFYDGNSSITGLLKWFVTP